MNIPSYVTNPESLRSDMRAEEEGVLRADLLRDDPTAVVVECG